MVAQQYQEVSFIPQDIPNMSHTSFWKGNRVQTFDLDLQGQSSWSPSAIKAVSFFCFEGKWRM